MRSRLRRIARKAVRIDTEMVAAVFILLILGAIVAGALFLLVRFWGQCNAETEHARERIDWPTATVEATLYDVELRTRRIDRPPYVIGLYRYEFGGIEHATEKLESIHGTKRERETAAEELRNEGKTIDLEVQYNPEDSTEVSDEIVTSVPNCRPWIGGFFIFFCLIGLLILRGCVKTVPAIFR